MKEAKLLDDMHFSSSRIDGTQKKIRFAISAREDGKSTTLAMKTYNKFVNEKATTILFKRFVNDVTPLYIDSLFKPFKKFRKAIVYTYRKGDIENGVIPVYTLQGDMIFLIVCLNVPKARYKSLVVENPALMAFDEFIIDTRAGEKYLRDEAFRVKEAYKTFYREGANIPLYFFGNPYSLYNPYFLEYGVNARELAEKRFLNPKNEDWCAEYHELDPRLVADILKRDPTHKFDDDFFKYAIEGIAINDKNVRLIEKQPQGFSLSCVFLFEGRFYGIYRTMDYFADPRFWVGMVEYDKIKRRVFCFDFKDLCKGARLFSRSERDRFTGLVFAMRNRQVAFENLACNYAVEAIYPFL